MTELTNRPLNNPLTTWEHLLIVDCVNAAIHEAERIGGTHEDSPFMRYTSDIAYLTDSGRSKGVNRQRIKLFIETDNVEFTAHRMLEDVLVLV